MSDTLTNDRLLRALRRQPVDRTPVWLMRHTGRYLPEYRATRAAAGSFLTHGQESRAGLRGHPAAAAPLPAGCGDPVLGHPHRARRDGPGLYFVEGEGPKFERPIRDESDVAKLAVPDMESELRYVMDAVRVIRRELAGAVPLIGFSGSPWTLACYMVEGGGSDNYGRIKAMAFNRPELLHRLLGVVTDAVIAYLSAQRAAGAQALQVFDTWGGVLSPSMYREFSLPYLQRIARELDRGDGDARTPLILFGKGNAPHLEALAATGTDAVGVDWLVDLSEAARRTGGTVALQGNLDPATLYGSPQAIAREAARVLDDYAAGNGGSREGHVFNLGHGMSPDMDPEHVAALVAAVHAHSAR